MKYTPQEVMQYIQEEDVKFIRLAFCDVYGCNKNISIMPQELERAFEYGIGHRCLRHRRLRRRGAFRPFPPPGSHDHCGAALGGRSTAG